MGSHTQRTGIQVSRCPAEVITRLTRVGEGRLGPLGLVTWTLSRSLARQGKEPEPEQRDRSLSKLKNRADYVVPDSERLDMADKQVSMGRGEVGCDRQFYSFLGKLWAEGIYRMETSWTEIRSLHSLWTLEGAG